jgi:hypothetical protein
MVPDRELHKHTGCQQLLVLRETMVCIESQTICLKREGAAQRASKEIGGKLCRASIDRVKTVLCGISFHLES